MWFQMPSVQNLVEANFSDKDFVHVSVTEDCDPASPSQNLKAEAH